MVRYGQRLNAWRNPSVAEQEEYSIGEPCHFRHGRGLSAPPLLTSIRILSPLRSFSSFQPVFFLTSIASIHPPCVTHYRLNPSLADRPTHPRFYVDFPMASYPDHPQRARFGILYALEEELVSGPHSSKVPNPSMAQLTPPAEYRVGLEWRLTNVRHVPNTISD